VSVKVKVLEVGTVMPREVQLVGLERLVEPWTMLVRLAVVITVNWNWPSANRITLVSVAGASGRLVTITVPVMPEDAWLSTVHS